MSSRPTTSRTTTSRPTVGNEEDYAVTVAVTKAGVLVSGADIRVSRITDAGATGENKKVSSGSPTVFSVQQGCYVAHVELPPGERFEDSQRNWTTVEGCVGPEWGNNTINLVAVVWPDVVVDPDAESLQATHTPITIEGTLSPGSPSKKWVVRAGSSGGQFSILVDAINGDPQCGSHGADPVVTVDVDWSVTRHVVSDCGVVKRVTFPHDPIVQFEIALPSGATANMTYTIRLAWESA